VSTLRQAAQITTGEIRYLVIATVKDYENQILPHSPAVDVPLYFSNMPYMQRRDTGSGYEYKRFEPRVETPLNINLSMFDAGLTGGFVRPQGGTIKLSNGDGALDYLLLNHSFEQQPIEIRMLRGIGSDDVVADHPLIFKGLTQSISATEDYLEIVVGDFMTQLDRTFPPNKFSAAGEPEGIRKPITLGKVFNVPAVLQSESSNKYKVHDGAITSIDAVYVAGELQTLTTDYTVDTTNGEFTMVSTPTGVVTADVTNNVTKGSYTNGAGVILEEMATTYGGLSTGTEILTSPFRTLEVNDYEHGAFFDQETTLLEAMNELLVSIGAFIFSNGGPLSINVPEFPTVAPASVDPVDDDDIIAIEVLPTAVFAGVDVNVKYKRNYRELSENELGSSPDDRDFATREWRVESVSVASLQLAGNFSELREVTVETTITNSSDANDEALRLANFYLRDAKVYRVQMKLNPLYMRVGESVNISSSRFGLSSGRNFLILSKFEDLQANEVTLEVMG